MELTFVYLSNCSALLWSTFNKSITVYLISLPKVPKERYQHAGSNSDNNFRVTSTPGGENRHSLNLFDTIIFTSVTKN